LWRNPVKTAFGGEPGKSGKRAVAHQEGMRSFGSRQSASCARLKNSRGAQLTVGRPIICPARCRENSGTRRGYPAPSPLPEQRDGQIKRFQAGARDANVDDLTVIPARVSSNDIASFITKIKTLSGVTEIGGEAERSSRQGLPASASSLPACDRRGGPGAQTQSDRGRN
jgi:hypothetical protein